MTLAIIIFSFIFVSAAGVKVWRMYRGESRRLAAVDTNESLNEGFSWPANQVIRVYDELPEENRPTEDIRVALRALDKKYEGQGISAHFLRRSYYSSTYTWDCACIYNDFSNEFIGEKCVRFPEYKPMYDSIVSVHNAIREQQKAIAERERQLMIAGLEHDLRSVDRITEAFRQEREIIESTTKEIV